MLSLGLPIWPNIAGVGGGFSPTSLSGLLFWLDPSNLSTMFTDTAGTTPAAVGDYVARINDAGGSGLYVSQATANLRHKLASSGGLYWLEVDAGDGSVVDFYTISTPINLTDNMTVYHALHRSAAGTKNVGIGNSTTTSARYSGWWYSDNKIYVGMPTGLLTAGADTGTGGNVLVSRRTSAGPAVTVRKNAVQYYHNGTGAGALSGAFDYVFRISGEVASSSNRQYGLAVYSNAHADGSDELADMETYMGAKAGITL